MNNRTLLTLILGILLIVFVSAFLLLDFRLIGSRMAVDFNASTYSFGLDEDSPLELEQNLYAYVRAERGLEGALQDALSERLSTNPYFGEIILREGALSAVPDSLLMVDVDEGSTILWTPFFARAMMTVEMVYASDGEVDWIDADVVSATNTAGPVVRRRAEYVLDGHSYGLISRPGYATVLADELATSINESLADMMAEQVRLEH